MTGMPSVLPLVYILTEVLFFILIGAWIGFGWTVLLTLVAFIGGIALAGWQFRELVRRTMYDKDLWILVSCNDLKAHPGMDAVTAAIEENGGKVARFGWDASAGPDALNAMALEALQTDANVRYTVFDGDTVVPPGEDPNPGSNHTCTWRTAYAIPAVRDWLFTARRHT